MKNSKTALEKMGDNLSPQEASRQRMNERRNMKKKEETLNIVYFTMFYKNL